MIENDIALAAVSLAEAQAFARIDAGEEEELLERLIRSASALCEQFTGQVLVARPFTEIMTAKGCWQRLGLTPVRSIGAVQAVAPDGSATGVPAGDFEVDIDGRCDGWVRLLKPVEGRIRVAGIAGLASEQSAIPEPLRQGILRLVAHLFAARDGEGGEPPAAVTALLRPYRRMRLA
jgi:uncharacterized phiE125 gp8 family phage protein